MKVTIAITPLADGVFPVTGASSARVRQDVTISGLSIPAVSGSSTLHFNATTLAIIGSVNNDDNTCERTTSFTALPSSASVGGSGSLSTDDSLDRCTSPFVTVGNSTTTWSLEAEAGMALLCLNTTMRDLVGAVLGTESDCVEIIGSGALGTHARATVAVPLAGGTVTLVARNY